MGSLSFRIYFPVEHFRFISTIFKGKIETKRTPAYTSSAMHQQEVEFVASVVFLCNFQNIEIETLEIWTNRWGKWLSKNCAFSRWNVFRFSNFPINVHSSMIFAIHMGFLVVSFIILRFLFALKREEKGSFDRVLSSFARKYIKIARIADNLRSLIYGFRCLCSQTHEL